ncbi:hypothetical protein ACOSP7_032120 [Xanthoceras sorbifolium]|uniref:Patellin-1-6 C-terminal GOLD domain-containing protein n=1 Tax=Xanthoceras sorbifolium TaxID=99658 RepID=A0ABQ8H515_9ROSI|nr:hypothetical protein JRO89_XS14G0120900 [Xanthoceras sorbifolium]
MQYPTSEELSIGKIKFKAFDLRGHQIARRVWNDYYAKISGWDLEYSAEFVPNAEGSYTIAVEKPRKMTPSEEAIHNSYTSREAGKLVLSVDNPSSRRKKVAAYRYIVRKLALV